MAPSLLSGDLNLDAIRAHLRTHTLGQRIHLLDTTSSTNAVAMGFAQQGATDGTVVVADHQTAGRGRLGRSWFSPAGSNLYCSIILRRAVTPAELTHWLAWIPLTTGIAAVRAVHTVTGLEPTLKWPNDVLMGGRKVGGVLCETSGGQHGQCVIVGIGLNVNLDPQTIPEEFRQHSTSLAAEATRRIDRAKLLAALLSELEACWDDLSTGKQGELRRTYCTLCSTLAQLVRVSVVDGATVIGRAVSIGSDGSLHIIPEASEPNTGDQPPVIVRAGDVVHLRERTG